VILLESATYVHAKEGCYLCGKGGPVVDTGVDIEGEGALAICDGCIHDLAVALGLDVEESLLPQLEEVRDQLVQAQARADRAETALAAGVSAAAEKLRDTRNER
jgi:hypothetical protein